MFTIIHVSQLVLANIVTFERRGLSWQSSAKTNGDGRVSSHSFLFRTLCTIGVELSDATAGGSDLLVHDDVRAMHL